MKDVRSHLTLSNDLHNNTIHDGNKVATLGVNGAAWPRLAETGCDVTATGRGRKDESTANPPSIILLRSGRRMTYDTGLNQAPTH